ncbi:unnamed protein product [Ceratitis capitata]|uniref:(Mediterranean fruit fly) hypothetical protein n=1 Tax=Ceratitis capitata TaxID=7213 RepID=A0A811US67_CERCA|nr:unnamed protein product [Ceratitis capitata]
MSDNRLENYYIVLLGIGINSCEREKLKKLPDYQFLKVCRHILSLLLESVDSKYCSQLRVFSEESEKTKDKEMGSVGSCVSPCCKKMCDKSTCSVGMKCQRIARNVLHDNDKRKRRKRNCAESR